jgi:predicted metal-dependent HD superfamily phosphohydrolase
MSWSQILHTELADVVMDIIETNVDSNMLTYHNMDHVDAMYDYLAETNEDYDEALDWAILFHDAVYDAQSEKERRSAELFTHLVKMFDGCVLGDAGKQRVVELIMSTVDHVVTKPCMSPIIRADLAGLASPISTYYNYSKIMEESKNLYNITETDFAEANILYMRKLRDTLNTNWQQDPQHAKFYVAVKRGINQTINTSKMLQGYSCGEI